MTTALQTELGQLTGEELHHLILKLADAQASAAVAFTLEHSKSARAPGLQDMLLELIDTLATVTIQAARITLPLADAAALIYRQAFARHHPVRVPGT